MKKDKSIHNCLLTVKRKTISAEDKLIFETKKILNNDLISEKNILQHLGHYKQMNELVNEESVDGLYVFSVDDIYKTAVNYRLKFLDSRYFNAQLPYELVLKIKDIEKAQQKGLKHFKILSGDKSFRGKENTDACALFVKTNHNNYFLIHQWGERLSLKRKIINWPLRNFETFALSIACITFIEGLLIPNSFIIREPTAEYWNGYRGGTFFHLLIINTGFSVYLLLTFAKNFSNNLWNRKNDFD
ncbi:MAG: hypothetical protein WCR21_05910 [Bacteroidota bacterium]